MYSVPAGPRFLFKYMLHDKPEQKSGRILKPVDQDFRPEIWVTQFANTSLGTCYLQERDK